MILDAKVKLFENNFVNFSKRWNKRLGRINQTQKV